MIPQIYLFSKFNIENPKSRRFIFLLFQINWSIRFTSLLFDVIRPSHSWDMAIWKKNDLEIQVQGYGWVRRSRSHSGPNNLSTHTPFVPYNSSLPFMIFIVLKTFKIQGQGHGWGQSHKVGSTSHRLTSPSFHVNRPCHFWYTAFTKFDLENQGHGAVQSFKDFQSTHILFHVNRPSHSWYKAFSNLTLKISDH